MQSPGYWQDKATEAQDVGDWKAAADCWLKAKGASTGHKRRDRYERAYDSCMDKARWEVMI